MKEETKRYYDATKFNAGDLCKEIDGEIPENWRRIFYKSYPRFPSMPLMNCNIKGDIGNLLRSRSTTREFSDENLRFWELSDILYWSAGLKSIRGYDFPNRMYPSAGARYPLEIYTTIHGIEHLQK